MASFSHADLIAALESQFDYLSARTIAGFVLKGAGLAEKAKYDKADADAVLAGLDAEAGGRADAIKDRLAAPAPAPAKKAPAKKPAAK